MFDRHRVMNKFVDPILFLKTPTKKGVQHVNL